MRVVAVASVWLMLASMVCGCTTRQGDFTLLSTRNVDLDNLGKARKLAMQPPVVGRSARHRLLLILPVSSRANLEVAIDRALDKGGGDYMTDAVVKRYWWCIPFIYTQSGWQVQGKVVNSRQAGAVQ